MHRPYRGVEQLEARRAHNPEVVGSSPTSATTKTDTKRCLFFIIYLDSKFGLEPTSGSPERRKPFWGEEEQWNKRQITFALRINKSGLERYGTCDDEEAPNLASVTSSKFGRNSPGGLFRNECAISVLPPQPPRRRLFTPSFFIYRTQAHIRTAHKQAPEIPVSVFYCQR